MVSSATFNEAPATSRDYWIAKGILLSNGLTTLDPNNGVTLSPTKPSPYHYETRGPGIIAGLVISIVFMTVVTGARLFLRFFSGRLKWGMDDVLMIPALFMAVAYPALQIGVVTHGGGGRHIYDVTYEDYYNYKWLASVAQIDFFVCVGVVKMSIAAFNIRLTNMASQKWKIANWIFFGLCAVYIVIAFFLNIFQCVPAPSNFDIIYVARMGTVPKCLGIAQMNTILRAINIALDFLLLATPVVVLYRVQMSKKKKARLMVVFSIGIMACIGSVMTLVAKFHLKSDALWNYTGILGWSLVELVFGVLAASLPTLSALLPSGARSGPYHSGNGYHMSNYGHGTKLENRGQYTSQASSEGRRFESHPESDTVGIIRQDEVELKYNTASEPDEEPRVGLFGYEDKSMRSVTAPAPHGRSADKGGQYGWSAA